MKNVVKLKGCELLERAVFIVQGRMPNVETSDLIKIALEIETAYRMMDMDPMINAKWLASMIEFHINERNETKAA